MTKLNDRQRILLATASQRDILSIFPLPASVDPAKAAAALAALERRGLVAEAEVKDPAACHRRDGDLMFGLIATDVDLGLIGIAPDGAAEGNATTDPSGSTPATRPQPPAPTKVAAALALLQRDEGATLDQLVAATGWLPHTTRAALTGLKKKGHALTSSKTDGARTYRIATAS